MNENEMEETVLEDVLETNKEKLRANEPLSILGKVIFFILTFGLIQLIVAFNYRSIGKKKKYRDAMLFMLYGFIAWILFFAIVGSL